MKKIILLVFPIILLVVSVVGFRYYNYQNANYTIIFNNEEYIVTEDITIDEGDEKFIFDGRLEDFVSPNEKPTKEMQTNLGKAVIYRYIEEKDEIQVYLNDGYWSIFRRK